DINDSGNAVKRGGVYNYATNSFTPIDTNATSLYGINNNGDLLGGMPFLINGTTLEQAAYKTNGVWHPIGFFPNITDQGACSPGQISENGRYIAGQMSPDCCDYQAFLYNTTTGVLEKIANPANEYSAGYAVNNTGLIGGWYDPQPSGTLRVPAYMTTGSVITAVGPTLPVLSSINQVGAINNSNVMVGDFDGRPFIYNLATNTFSAYNAPTGYDQATFTSISENGIAVGYAQNIGAGGSIEREAIVYHPSLGSQPVFLTTILAAHGIPSVNTFDGKLGTAIAISPDGNFVCGWENGFFAFASGWVINFSNMLISDCYATCPQDINTVSLTGPQVVNYTVPITCPSHPNATVVLASGLASGSLFPIGTTHVVNNLMDTNGTVLNSCSFNVTIDDHYCNPMNPNQTVEPITLTQFADINNPSSDTSQVNYEDFTAIVGHVMRGTTYNAKFKGLTGGNFSDFISVFVDWNQNGYFDPTTEKYDIGSLTNSTGLDTVELRGTIAIPITAQLGTTTMRVMKNYDAASNVACFIPSGFGQVEDYKLVITDVLATKNTSETNFSHFPNPVNDILTLSCKMPLTTVTVYNVLGQTELQTKPNSLTTEVSLAQLPTGTYFVKMCSQNSEKTVKIHKL
ncbi:MAG: hypothetical protein RI894_2349, partial [Bacteroidota bacterium]